MISAAFVCIMLTSSIVACSEDDGLMLMMMLWQMPSQVIGAYDNGWHGFNAGDMNADDGDTKAVIAIMTRLAALIVYDIASNNERLCGCTMYDVHWSIV